MVKRYVCIPRSFLVINVCNQGKNLFSPCITLPCLQFLWRFRFAECRLASLFYCVTLEIPVFFHIIPAYLSQTFRPMCKTQFFLTSAFIVFSSKIFSVSVIPSFRYSAIISHVQHIAITSFQKPSKTSL